MAYVPQAGATREVQVEFLAQPEDKEWCHVPVISATWETEAGGLWVYAWLGQKWDPV